MKKYIVIIRNIFGLIAIYFFTIIVINYICSGIYTYTYKQSIEQTMINNPYTINAIANVVTFFVYILILRNKKCNLWDRCNFKKFKVLDVCKSTIIGISTAAFSCSMVFLISNNFESYKEVSNNLSLAFNSIWSMVCLIVIAPIFEEILFRGLIFYELKKFSHVLLAVILQAIIFSVAHGNMLQAIYTFIFGITLNIIYICTKSIGPNIICHMTYNLFGLIFIPICLSYTSDYVYVYIIVGLIVTILLLINMLREYNKSIINTNVNAKEVNE